MDFEALRKSMFIRVKEKTAQEKVWDKKRDDPNFKPMTAAERAKNFRARKRAKDFIDPTEGL